VVKKKILLKGGEKLEKVWEEEAGGEFGKEYNPTCKTRKITTVDNQDKTKKTLRKESKSQ